MGAQNFGLHLRLRANGFAVLQRNGVYVGRPAGNDTAIQAIIDAWTLADQRDYAKTVIDQHARDARDRATADYSAAEMAQWKTKEAEARAYYDDSGASVPNLQREATARGLTLDQLATKVIAKADAFLLLDAAVWARRQTLVDALNTAADFAAVNAIEISSYKGWPV